MKKTISRFLSAGSVALLTIISFWAAAAPPIQVTAADPSAAPQGTISLDVAVSGSGFDSSAAVAFLVTGTTNPGGITVKKVNVAGPKKLIATIDIADTAVVASFDIQVTQSGGRKGKGTTLFSVQAKGKPTAEPPPLPPPGSCAGAPGVFPAFAYTKNRTHKQGRTRVFDGSDLFIANSTGSCSVKLLTDDGSGPSYRQIGNEAVIAWANAAELKLLRLPIDNGIVVPIRPTIVYTNHGLWPYGVALSNDGRTIYFLDSYSPAEGHWQYTLKSIDISTCTANCTPQVVYTPPVDVGLGGLSVNDADDRIYISIQNLMPGMRTISLLQKQAGVWTLLRHVVSNHDSAYSSVRDLSSTAIGRWDYQSSSVVKDVLAFVVENSSGDSIDLIDVSNCGGTETLSCYGSGESALVRSGIAGHMASFTTAPASSDPAPNLLISDGNWRDANETVREVDPDSMSVTPLLNGAAAESAD